MSSRRVHEDSRCSKKEVAASGVSTRNRSVNEQSKETKAAGIANTETLCYRSASECSRASKGQNGYKNSLIESSIVLKTILTG